MSYVCPLQRNVWNIELSKTSVILDKQKEKKNSGQGQLIMCKYLNSGYCKYEDNCTFKHPKTVCKQTWCQNKVYQNRHYKIGRFKEGGLAAITVTTSKTFIFRATSVVTANLSHMTGTNWLITWPKIMMTLKMYTNDI